MSPSTARRFEIGRSFNRDIVIVNFSIRIVVVVVVLSLDRISGICRRVWCLILRSDRSSGSWFEAPMTHQIFWTHAIYRSTSSTSFG